MPALNKAVRLTTTPRVFSTTACRPKYMAFNNTHSADVLVTILDGQGLELFSENVKAGSAPEHKQTEFRYSDCGPYFEGGISIKASVDNVVVAWLDLGEA